MGGGNMLSTFNYTLEEKIFELFRYFVFVFVFEFSVKKNKNWLDCAKNFSEGGCLLIFQGGAWFTSIFQMDVPLIPPTPYATSGEDTP